MENREQVINALTGAIEKKDRDLLEHLQLQDPAAVQKEHLFLAAKTGFFEGLCYLTEYSRVSLSERDEMGRSALHYAALADSAECFAYLVKRCGLDPLAGDKEGVTPWELALGNSGSLHSGANSPKIAAWMEEHYGSYDGYYKNPIRQGMFPDPSICRVGDTYYMVNSSFVFFPCIPISASKDLVHWDIIGHAVTDPEWAELSGLEGGRGFWAPDISYDAKQGRFYITATWRNNDTPPVYRRQMVVWSTSPEGPYSKPAFIDEDGIDPCLFHEEDGRHYMLLNRGARILELNEDCTEQISEARLLYYGDMKRAPEGPHIYKKDGYYYLLMAEGGTGLGHRVTVMRSKTLMGEYEPCPHNPVMIQRDELGYLQRCGHGDLVDTPDGRWYMVYLCGRLLNGSYSMLGRETALDPVTWTADGWPVVNRGKGPSVLQRKPFPQGDNCPGQTNLQTPKLSAAGLPMDYMTVRGFQKEDIRCRLSENGTDWIFDVRGSRYPLRDAAAGNMVLRRQTAFSFDAAVTLTLPTEMEEGQEAGILGYYDENTWCAFGILKKQGSLYLFSREHIGDEKDKEQIGEKPFSFADPRRQSLTLCMQTRGLQRSLCYADAAGASEPMNLCRFGILNPVYYLCDEGLSKGKRFTGAMFGFYALEGQTARQPFYVKFETVRYQNEDESFGDCGVAAG